MLCTLAILWTCGLTGCRTEFGIVEESFVEESDTATPLGEVLRPEEVFDSCRDVLAGQRFAKDGRYRLRGVGREEFVGWCEQQTAGGGWLLVAKQVDHQSGSFAPDTDLLGHWSLQSPAFDRTSPGSLLGFGDPSEVLFVPRDGGWVRLTDDPLDWARHEAHTDIACRDVQSVEHACDGVDCSVYQHLTMDLGESPDMRLSVLALGAWAGVGGGEQCGESWCSATRHGRYDGWCQSGPVGQGDWLVFTR